jgi:signal transduction histidine kinase
VEHLNRDEQACAVTAAAAHDFNNELTVILSGVCGALAELEPNHPARHLLIQARAAAQRCAWQASGMLSFSARQGIMPVRDTLDHLMAD